jgi:hypothetical protein
MQSEEVKIHTLKTNSINMETIRPDVGLPFKVGSDGNELVISQKDRFENKMVTTMWLNESMIDWIIENGKNLISSVKKEKSTD